MRDGLRLFSPAASLVGVAETFFARNPVESQVLLASLADAWTFCGSCSTAATREKRAILRARSGASAEPNWRRRLSAR
jgi:hypothetical protein